MPALLRRTLVLAVSIALLAPAAALGSSAAVIRDCTDDGRLSGTYTQKDYREALDELPTDVDEYTDCRDVIRSAQLGAAGGGGGGAGSGGGATGTGGGTGTGGTGGTGTPGAPGTAPPSTADEVLATASPQERAALEAARTGGGKPIRLGDQLVDPGALGFGKVAAVNSVPTPLVVLLVLLALATGAGGALALRGRRLPFPRRSSTA